MWIRLTLFLVFVTSISVRLLVETDYPALRSASAMLGLLTILVWRRSLPARPLSGDYGTAGFASEAEIADLLLPHNVGLPHGSLLLGRKGARQVAQPAPFTAQHGVIVGGSGTGKSYSFFLPNVAAASTLSCVVTDPKSELWNFTSGYARRATRYAPGDPDASACLNWIPLCRDARLAELCARAIVEAGAVERQEPP